MLNNPSERIKKRCPKCVHWGRGHVIDVVTREEICTARLVDELKIDSVVKSIENKEATRVTSWSECVDIYRDIRKPSFLDRVFKRKKKPELLRCAVCGKAVPPDTYGGFCSMECAQKYIEAYEAKEKDGTDKV